MTHSGGTPHAVGDRGQRYEITVFDDNLGQRVVVGWTDDASEAARMGTSAEVRPSWNFSQVWDRSVAGGDPVAVRTTVTVNAGEVAK